MHEQNDQKIFTALSAWWLWRSGCTRSHSELGRETLQRRWYFVSRRGRVGRCQAYKAVSGCINCCFQDLFITSRCSYQNAPCTLVHGAFCVVGAVCVAADDPGARNAPGSLKPGDAGIGAQFSFDIYATRAKDDTAGTISRKLAETITQFVRGPRKCQLFRRPDVDQVIVAV